MSSQRAALYIRTSTDTENQALDFQNSQLSEYADLNNYDVVYVYHDAGSDLSVDRPGLQRLLADAEAGRFDTVLTLDAARLSPDGHLFQDLFNRLGRLVGLIFVLYEKRPKEGYR